MLTLFRGGPTVWISDEDAKEHNIQDNDWLEVYNRALCDPPLVSVISEPGV
jgi:nitrate reductase alpha subunit